MTKKLNKTKSNKPKLDKTKLKKMSSFFKKNNDYMKKKKIFLLIFGVIFAATIGLTVAFFNFNFNNNKTTIELPFVKSFEPYEIEEIEEISTDCLETNCVVQQSTTTDEISLEKHNKLTISCFENIQKNNPNFKTKINNLIYELQRNYKNNISIKHKEEVLITNLEIASLNQLTETSLIVLAAIVLVIITLFYIIAFRKINGFFAALSFLAVAIFNTSFYVAVCFVLSSFLNINNLEKFAFPLCAIFINLIFNTTMLFSVLQNKIIKKTSQYMLKDSVNEVINSTKFHLFINFIIFCVIPSFGILAFKIFSAFVSNEFVLFETTVAIFTAYFVSGLILLLSSALVILQLFSIFKKPKKVKKQKQQEQQKQNLTEIKTLS